MIHLFVYLFSRPNFIIGYLRECDIDPIFQHQAHMFAAITNVIKKWLMWILNLSKSFVIPKNTTGPVTVVKEALLAQDEVWFYAIMLL